MKNKLLIVLIVLLGMLIFGNKENFTNETYCNWFDYNIDPHKCPNGKKCANIGVCRSTEDCEMFPDIKCK